MLVVYINYPNKRITIHGDYGCKEIQKRNKNKRRIRVTQDSKEERLSGFRDSYRFGSKKEVNDMWVEIDFQNQMTEMQVLGDICNCLSTRYRGFKDAIKKPHCSRK